MKQSTSYPNFQKYKDQIRRHYFDPLDRTLSRHFRLIDHGEISIFYAPFDYINKDAKAVICGITPGLRQALLAFSEARRQLKLEKNDHEVLLLAK